MFRAPAGGADRLAAKPVFLSFQGIQPAVRRIEVAGLYDDCRGERTGCAGSAFRRLRMPMFRTMTPIRDNLRNSTIGRVTCVTVLISFCAVCLPIPVFPHRDRPAKDLSQPFPCQNRSCGCSSADQCWKKCCCFTNAQKVAWAKKNSVAVPQFVLIAARAEAGQDSELCCHQTVRQKPTSVTGCCTGDRKRSEHSATSAPCCLKKERQPGCSCGKRAFEKTQPGDQEAEPLTAEPAVARLKFASGLSAAECQGFSFVIALLTAVVGTESPAIESPCHEQSELLVVMSERRLEIFPEPPVPPPRNAAVL